MSSLSHWYEKSQEGCLQMMDLLQLDVFHQQKVFILLQKTLQVNVNPVKSTVDWQLDASEKQLGYNEDHLISSLRQRSLTNCTFS